MKRVSPVDTSPLIMECQKCAHREWAEIQIPPPWPGKDEDIECKRVVVYRTEGPAQAEEIQALRKLSEELRRLPVTEAAQRIGSSKAIDLGIHPVLDARDIVKRAESWGLKAGLEQPEEQSMVTDDTGLRLFEPFGAPVTVGEHGDDTRIVPFGWIVIGGAVVIAVIIVVLISC